MKKFISVALIVCMAFTMTMFMAGCGSKDEGAGAEADALKITAVFATALGDQSFNDSAKIGMDQLAGEGFVTNTVECDNNADMFEQNLRSAADEANVVVGVGSELNMIAAVAADYPDVKFIWIDNVDDNYADHENLLCVSYKQNEGSYLVGYVAGMMTESNVVGFIGGQDIPVINDFRVGYEQGAKAANPDVKIVKMFTDDWADTNKGAECAQTLAGQGADIIFAAAGGSGSGAILKAEELGIKCIGVDQDQRISMPDYADFIICSMVKDVGTSVYNIVKDIDAGNWAGGDIFYAGMDGGYITVGYGEDPILVPEDVQAAVNAEADKIGAGEVTVDTAF